MDILSCCEGSIESFFFNSISTQQTVPKNPMESLEHHRTIKHHGKPQNIFEHHETPWNPIKENEKKKTREYGELRTKNDY